MRFFPSVAAREERGSLKSDSVLAPPPGKQGVLDTDGLPAVVAAGDVCRSLPAVWSSFIDAFVDHTVGGQVLGQQGPRPGSKGAAPWGGNESAPPVTFLPAAERVVAVGDLHGDIAKTREALRIAGVIDHRDRWVGKSTVLVQVGDQLDRGGEELQVLYLLEKLRREAPRAGGAVHMLHGNHETGNIEGWFKYAFPAGFVEFQRWAAWERVGRQLKRKCKGHPPLGPPSLAGVPASVPQHHRARYAALRPGGPIATRFLASHSAVLQVGNTLFVHGGLLPAHAQYGLARMNGEARDWVSGGSGRDTWGQGGQSAPRFVRGSDAIVWLRKYSMVDPQQCDCELLQKTLALLPGVDRMVVGHTIQPEGINTACGGRVVRIDVGMSAGCYDAPPQVLEILKNGAECRALQRGAPPRPLGGGGPGGGFWQRLKGSLREVLGNAPP